MPNPCPECGESHRREADPVEPGRVIVVERHRRGCGWSPCISPKTEDGMFREYWVRSESGPGGPS